MKIDTSKNVLGKPKNRVDGVLKVTGHARYAAEQQLDEKALVGWLVSSATAVGEITHLSTEKAEKAETEEEVDASAAAAVATTTFGRLSVAEPMAATAVENEDGEAAASAAVAAVEERPSPQPLLVDSAVQTPGGGGDTVDRQSQRQTAAETPAD